MKKWIEIGPLDLQDLIEKCQITNFDYLIEIVNLKDVEDPSGLKYEYSGQKS